MLSCLLRPSGGDALVDGHSVVSDPQAVKSVIGVVPQDIAVYPDMTARENLVFWGRMYGLAGAELEEPGRRGARADRPRSTARRTASTSSPAA